MIRREDMYNQLILFRCKGPPLHDTPLELYSFGTAVGTTDVLLDCMVRDSLIRMG